MKTLPMIEFASSLFDKKDLKDCYIIGVQHILPTTYIMFKSLFNKGLKPENLSLIGKCYSTDYLTYKQMISEGIDLCESSIFFDSHKPFDQIFEDNIINFLKKRKKQLNSHKYKKIIVLDDGGHLLSEIEKYVDPKNTLVGMEQTSSGYNRLKNQTFNFPIVNLARAEAKLKIEPKKISDNCIKKIKLFLKKSFAYKPNILIIGNGFIGASLYKSLSKEYSVTSYDIDSKKTDLISLDSNKLKTFDFIIGCTGEISLSSELHPFLKKGAILASLSSSDREFDGVHFRKNNPQTNNCFQNISCNGILLLNSGFPITFNNEDVDDPNFFQFVRSLIISSIHQSLGNFNKNGFVELDKTLQKSMVNSFKKITNF